jgi:hypothetical protein
MSTSAAPADPAGRGRTRDRPVGIAQNRRDPFTEIRVEAGRPKRR